MYLLVADGYALTGQRQYFSRNDVNFERIKQVSPEIANISTEDIEEILIFSIKNIEGSSNGKITNCVKLKTDETSIRIDYGEMHEHDDLAINIRNRLYGNLVRSGRMNKNEIIPDVVLINNIKDYNYVKAGKAGVRTENQSWLDKFNELIEVNDWKAVVDISPPAEKIEESAFWDDSICLSKISFALSKLASKNDRRMNSDEITRRKKHKEYFLKAINRCIELDPCSSAYKSVLAYFYYNSYISSMNEEYYVKALPLYKDLVESSFENFKESYRYATLLQYHLGRLVFDEKYTSEWFQEYNSVIDIYVQLIDEYDGLSEERRKKYKKHFIGALFQYAKMQIDHLLKKTWDNYFNYAFNKSECKSYQIDDTQLQRIDKSAEYLRKALELSPDKVSRDNIDDNPNYFELRYRLAQIEQVKGITLLMRGQSDETVKEYFERSDRYAEDTLNAARELSDSGFRSFMFPHYVRPIKAISLFFLKDYDACHRCFYKAAPYMLYEEAKIYLLCNQSEKALRVLSEIPENDKCRNKANKLRDSFEGKA